MSTDTTHPLGAIIPTVKGRKIAYAVYALASFLVGNAAIYLAATSSSIPMWIVGATAVINNLAPVFGAVAIANLPTGIGAAVEDVPPVPTATAPAGAEVYPVGAPHAPAVEEA